MTPSLRPTWHGLAVLLAALALSVSGCMESQPQVDQVQTNLVDKEIFEGEWWYTRTVVDVDSDEAYIDGTFEGDSGWADYGVDSGQSGTLARIRWVIDENYLFAYRAYELIDGGNDDGRDPNFRGQPLAAYKIEAHVDVRQSYNPVTGELQNVRTENTSDRRWYQRNFMRVDWSQNLITAFYDIGSIDSVYGQRVREPVPFFFQDGSHDEFPASYQPQFVRIGDDPTYRFRDEWPADQDSTIHYVSFVNQEVHSPGDQCAYDSRLPCQSVAVTVRNAFLRVPPNHQYPVATQSNEEFDQFGLFRTYQRTYVRGGQDRETRAEHCEFDEDCGVGGACDVVQNVCVGGLSPDYGETDFLAFYRPRHNFWMQSLTAHACVADWQCDGRYGDVEPAPGFEPKAGSVCDRAARVCTIPIQERATRQVAFHLNSGFAKHLVPAAFDIFGGWNEAFMRGQRAVAGRDIPTGEPVACQSDDPTAYCFCEGEHIAPEVHRDSMSCPYKYDPFMTPSAAEDAGVVDPYNCYVSVPEGVTLPTNPTSFDDYEAGVYGMQFTFDEARGPSECMLVLKTNSCDRDPSLPCEELGDLRYQFFNNVEHVNTGFGGVSALRVDPTTGELITANANMAGWTLEVVGTTALQYFPVLREEPGAEDRYFTGENLRGYFDRLGRTERPVSVAPSGTDGFSTSDDTSRPGIGGRWMSHDDRLEYVRSAIPRVERLHGEDARAQILQDRMRNLAGSPIEAQLVGSLGPNGADAIARHYDARVMPENASVTEPEIMDRVSPFRGHFMESLLHERSRQDMLSKHNVDPVSDHIFESRFWKYWADAFEGRPPAEASIRIQQLHLRAVMFHEMGHSVGLRHNFAGSLDRDQYYHGYFNTVLGDPDDPSDDLLAPDPSTFDERSAGGNADGSVDGEELTRYLAAVEAWRDMRNARGIGNTTSASIMDYHGDLGDFSGLGRYDVAATIWNYFEKVEAYVGDPRVREAGTYQNLRRDVPRRWWTEYRGGEDCDFDDQCPAAAGRIGDQPVTQRCIRNPRYSPLPAPCNGDQNCICSTFKEDFIDYTDGVGGYQNDVDEDGTLDFFPVDYLFCTDDRVNDISWCNRFDAGESFVEAIGNFRTAWEESYPRTYHRAFRRGCTYGDPNCASNLGFGSVQSIIDAAKIYQHLYFRFFFEPGFETDPGPLGFDNQFQACIDGMNWFAELVNLPEAGSYRFNADTGTYQHISEEMNVAGSDLSLGIGEGFPMWTQYQDGLNGFFRTERAGVFYDKYYAMLALALRDWGLSYTLDERYFINYYDLFPIEMTGFFGGLVSNDPRQFAARVIDGDDGEHVEHVSVFRNCGSSTPCQVDALPVAYPGAAIEGSSTEIMRNWATILSLATFPVFYDTQFEQRLSVFKLDSGDGFRIPDTQSDGSQTCAYGSALDASHTTTCPDEDYDYVVYSSDRLHSSYVAVKVRPRLAYNLPEEQPGFNLLRLMVDTQERIRELEVGGLQASERDEHTELTTLLTENDSFLEYLIEVQRSYGISSWL